jgi:hypothetical protein
MKLNLNFLQSLNSRVVIGIVLFALVVIVTELFPELVWAREEALVLVFTFFPVRELLQDIFIGVQEVFATRATGLTTSQRAQMTPEAIASFAYTVQTAKRYNEAVG